MSEEKSLGKLIYVARKQLGLSQQELADKFDTAVNRVTVGRWEKDEQRPSVQNFEELIGILDLNEQEAYALYYAGGKTPPERHNLPRENRLFTGRETYLAKLRDLLEQHHVVALSGLGGIGKTQIALKYAHQHHPDLYPTVLWVNAADKITLQAGFASLAETLKLPEKDEQELEPRIKAVRKWLEEHTNWLLVMDNADELPIVEEYLQSRPHGYIILTTRWQFPGEYAKPLEIEAMGPEEGLLFLLRRSGKGKVNALPQDVPEAAHQIVKELGGHALALEQAGTYIQQTSKPFAKYLKLYQERRGDLLSRYGALDNERITVAATFQASFTRVRELSPLTEDILHFCAFLHPDVIPEELFEHDKGFKADEMAFDSGIAALQQYSLIKGNEQEQTFSMHRLVQVVLIDDLSPDLQKQWREHVVRAVNAALPVSVYVTRPQWKRLLPQALAAAQSIMHYLIATEEAARLLFETASYLKAEAHFGEVEPLYQQALHIAKQRWGPEHPNVATTLNSLGNLYQEQGKYVEAESFYKESLTIAVQLYQIALHAKEAFFAAEEPYRQRVLHNKEAFAEAIQHRAKPLFHARTVHWSVNEQQRIRERTIREHIWPWGSEWRVAELLTSPLNNLAVIYHKQGKSPEAELLYQRALFIDHHFLPDSPDLAELLDNLAMVYTDLGKYREARQLHEEALARLAEAIGPLHPSVAYPLHGLANLYYEQGKYEQAESLYQKVLHIWEQTLGLDHPNVAYPLNNLASLYAHQGRYEQAEALYLRALSIQKQRLGPAHLNTQETRKDYAALLRSLGRDAEAATLEVNDEPSV